MSQIDLNPPGADPFDDGELTLEELERIAGGLDPNWSNGPQPDFSKPPPLPDFSASFSATPFNASEQTAAQGSGAGLSIGLPRWPPARGTEVEKKCDPFRPMMTYCYTDMEMIATGAEECELWSCNAQGDKYVYLQQLRFNRFSADGDAQVKANIDSAYSSFYGAGGTSFNHASGTVLNLTGSFP
jgi:hypothetical protein